MILRSGHAIGDTFYLFVHRCPGTSCAIERWIQWKAKKRKLDAQRLAKKLAPKRKHIELVSEKAGETCYP